MPVPGAFVDMNLTATSGAFPDASPGAVFDAAVAGSLIVSPPVTMDAIPVGPSGSLQDAINAASDGDTISLAPGTYRVHDLVILNKNLTITANESLGGTRENTIIDAERQGRIFDLRGNSDNDLILESLTLRNGYTPGNGGAINASGGVMIISSAISGSSAGGSGGAINTTGPVVIGYSTITGCTAGGDGGAGSGFTIQIQQSTITDCSAGGDGGAFSSSGNGVLIYLSTITGCTAGGNGGAVALETSVDTLMIVYFTTISDCHAISGNGGAVSSSGAVGIGYSEITGCSAGGDGGAAWSSSYGVSVSGSTIAGCSAGGRGGAVSSSGRLFQVVGTTISGCSAGGNGGAVYSEVDDPLIPAAGLLMDDAMITGCSAGGSGGAVYSVNSAPSVIMSSTFTGSRSAAPGGAVWSSSPAASMNFSRIYGNSAPAVYSYAGPFTAENNWWGSNANPSGFVGSQSGTVDYNPWLVLNLTATPLTVETGHSSAVRANLTYNSDNADTSPEGLFVPDGIVNRFSVTGAGTVTPSTAGTTDGVAGTTFTATARGTTGVCDTVDGQTLCVPFTVPFPPATLSPENDDDALPGITPAPTTDPSTVLPMTVTVNIGGESAAGRATVTGTKLSGLVVTGTVEPGPGTNRTAPPGIVYQYISLVPAGYGAIDNAVINFTVPRSWLDDTRIVPPGIILYHQTAVGWVELPTTNLYTKDGRVHYSAVSPGLSLFAIAGIPETAAAATMATTPAPVSIPVMEQAPVRTPAPLATQAPVAAETTAVPPAAGVPEGSSAFPVMPALLGICCVGLIGGGFFARRWWLRRQNPALFDDYE